MSSNPSHCCSSASPGLKLYQAFIFSVPIFFTFILLLLFYLFYLRRRRVDWSSLRMRSSYQPQGASPRPSDSGLKKELREMLPVIIFKESFLVKDPQCAVCLVDYQANDRLQQIPSCGHTFHLECIDNWLAVNSTCPLCRVSLIPSPKPNLNTVDVQHEVRIETSGLELSTVRWPGMVINIGGSSLDRNEEAASQQRLESSSGERTGTSDGNSSSRGGVSHATKDEAEQCVSDATNGIEIDVGSYNVSAIDRV